MESFKAFRIYEADGKSEGRIVDATLDELSPGDVVIRTAYSSVNYKDALAGTGAGRIIRRFPLIGGIDAAGTVLESGDPRFQKGDQVVASFTEDFYLKFMQDWESRLNRYLRGRAAPGSSAGSSGFRTE